ncbi:MAG TPA: hypothetical protein PLS03_05105 [Terrimicrobiaceae bacterium]|nr:hypothetical protein [Terrimicrobiaceae bacterium]
MMEQIGDRSRMGSAKHLLSFHLNSPFTQDLGFVVNPLMAKNGIGVGEISFRSG